MKITFEELLPTNPWLNARIGIDNTVFGEDEIKPMLHRLKKIVNEWHKEAYPHMYIDEVPNKTYFNAPQEQKIQTPEEIINEIGTCASIKTLETYRFVAHTNVGIMYAYHKKLKELTVNQ